MITKSGFYCYTVHEVWVLTDARAKLQARVLYRLRPYTAEYSTNIVFDIIRKTAHGRNTAEQKNTHSYR